MKLSPETLVLAEMALVRRISDIRVDLVYNNIQGPYLLQEYESALREVRAALKKLK